MRRFLLLLTLGLFSACGPWTPPAGGLTVTSVVPAAIDDDFTNQLHIYGQGFNQVDDLHFQLGGIAGPRITPVFLNILSDTEIVASLALADASNARWDLVMTTNVSNLCQPFTNVLRVMQVYAKIGTIQTHAVKHWWVTYTFSDASSQVINHLIFTNYQLDLIRGDVVRITSLSNDIIVDSVTSNQGQNYAVNLQGFSGELDIFNGRTIINWPTNGQILWEQ